MSTADTQLSLTVFNDTLYLTGLQNSVRGWNWLAAPAAFPLVTQATVGGVSQSLAWQFQQATLQTNDGQRLTLRHRLSN